jgi:hypothetical protein
MTYPELEQYCVACHHCLPSRVTQSTFALQVHFSTTSRKAVAVVHDW